MTKSISLLAVLAATALVSACTKVQGTEAKPARPVKTQAVTMAPAATGVRYSATIEAFQQVPLAFKASGYVNELIQRKGADGRQRAAQAGDQISRGTVLAKVHQADYQEKVNQGRAKLAEGEATLRKANLDLERAKTLFAAVHHGRDFGQFFRQGGFQAARAWAEIRWHFGEPFIRCKNQTR